MAVFDWNYNDKKDKMDDWIEYQVYKDITKNNSHDTSYSGNGMSSFGAVLSIAAGLVGQAVLYAILGIDAEKVPVIIMIILWIIISSVAAVLIETIGL